MSTPGAELQPFESEIEVQDPGPGAFLTQPEQQGQRPDWFILGFHDHHGMFVMASSALTEAQYVKHFEGYETGPELPVRAQGGGVARRVARLPVWRHMVGLVFSRFSMIRGNSFEECLRTLSEQWRPE
jgi:hypothetical protein